MTLQKAYKIADKYINKAVKERDKKGYRENLGYESYIVFMDEIKKLKLSYQEEAAASDYFHRGCDNI